MFIAFNSTFAPLFALGFLGMPRRVVTYPSNLQALNDWVSVSAFVLGTLDAGLPLQRGLVAADQARAGRGATRGTRSRSSSSCPRRCPSTTSIGSRCSTPTRIRTASSRPPRPALAPAGGGGVGHGSAPASAPTHPRHRARAARVAAAGALGGCPPCCAARPPSSSSRSCSPTSTCARSTSTAPGRSATVTVPVGWGLAIAVVLVLSAVALRSAAEAARTRPCSPAGRRARCWRCSSIVLQVVEWTTLGFGPASGGYASVYVGWTAFYAVFALSCAFWIETQVATAWRRAPGRSPGTQPPTPAEVALTDAVIASRARGLLVLLDLLRRDRRDLFVILYLV